MILIKNIKKSFNLHSVLNNFSLSVEGGSTVALLGLSGSGKTTVLKILCGLIMPDEGEIYFDNTPLKKNNLREIRKKIGYVIQDGGLFPHLTARENLTLLAREHRMASDFTEQILANLCEMTKISSELLDLYPRELSGGQRQRIGIMRSLFLDPDILLLDEPMGALDPITRNELQIQLKSLFKKLKKTVILVTHDLSEAAFLSDKIVLLNQGQIIQEGVINELIENPVNDFVIKFIQSQKSHINFGR